MQLGEPNKLPTEYMCISITSVAIPCTVTPYHRSQEKSCLKFQNATVYVLFKTYSILIVDVSLLL